MNPLSQEARYAARSASFIGAFGLVGRLLDRAGAFGQVLLIAAVLGSTTRADLYFIASIVPLALGNIVGEAIAAAILPRAAAEAESGAAEPLFAAGFWLAAGLLGMLTVAYLALVTVVVPIAGPGGTTSLQPWFAFAPVGVLYGLGTYCTAPLLHFERYVWPALRGAAATSTAFLLTALVLFLGGGVTWIGLAVSAGYGIALFLLLAELRSIGRLATIATPTAHALRGTLSLWRKFAASAASGVIGGQGLVLIERVLTAPLGVGAVASISYARGVAFTPAIFGQALAIGVYPSILRAHAAQAGDFVRARFVGGLRVLVFVTVCCATFVALYSGEITRVLFDRGPVSAASLVAVEHSLLAFSLALCGWMLTIYSSRLFTALNFFRGLMFQELIALGGFLATVLPLRAVWGVPGVALGFGIGQLAGGLAAMALIAVRLRIPFRSLAVGAVVPAAVRAVPVAGSLASVNVALSHGSGASAGVTAAAGLATLSIIAIGVMWLTRWPELEGMRRFIRRALRIPPPQ